MSAFRPAFAWQSRAVLGRHVRVHLRKWHTALLPPVCEPILLLLAFGVVVATVGISKAMRSGMTEVGKQNAGGPWP